MRLSNDRLMAVAEDGKRYRFELTGSTPTCRSCVFPAWGERCKELVPVCRKIHAEKDNYGYWETAP